MKHKKIGFALCGSYCTFETALSSLEYLTGFYEIVPIMSENAYGTDTRFGKASSFIKRIEELCSCEIIKTIAGAEPLGPSSPLDLLVIAPCTGNTLSKMSLGITDTSVTMAAKAHLRNGRPLLIAVSTNDALSANARNIGSLLTRKGIYFVPMRQDDSVNKPASLVADFDKLPDAIDAAFNSRQLQPLFCQ